MANLDSNYSYSHTSHYVDLQQFNNYVQGLLSSDKLDSKKKLSLEAFLKTDLYKEIQASSFWRHNIYNGGLSGPFTEYFALFETTWKKDFWNKDIQNIDHVYLNEHALPLAYRSTILKTQKILSEKVEELLNSGEQKIEISSLACGTMYDALGAKYKNSEKITFSGFDVDQESLELAQEKASILGYENQRIKLTKCNVVSSSLPENQYDIVVCNGFSFYIDDESLLRVIENVKKALKPNGVFLMSFIHPPTEWRLSDTEKKVGEVIQKIFDVFPMNWSANLRTDAQIRPLLEKGGFSDVSILEEGHQIHPLLKATKK